MTFSDTATVVFNLSYSADPTAIKAAIKAAVPQSLTTFTSVALNTVRTSVLGSTPYRGGNEVVIYVANDVSQDNPKSKLLMAAAALQATGAYVYSVGVGNQVSASELTSIGTLFSVPSYAGLAQPAMSAALVMKICVPVSAIRTTGAAVSFATSTTPAGTNVCDNADFIFVLDGSATVNPVTDWDNIQLFATRWVDTITANYPNPRFALVTFSSTATVNFNLSFSTNPMVIKTAIEAATPQFASTRASGALDAVRTQVLGSTPSRGGSSMILYVTNDVSQDSPRSILVTAANALKITGSHVVSFGVGDQISLSELFLIGNKVLEVFSFESLASNTGAYISEVCVFQPATTTTTASLTSPTTTQATLTYCTSNSNCDLSEYCDATNGLLFASLPCRIDHPCSVPALRGVSSRHAHLRQLPQLPCSAIVHCKQRLPIANVLQHVRSGVLCLHRVSAIQRRCGGHVQRVCADHNHRYYNAVDVHHHAGANNASSNYVDRPDAVQWQLHPHICCRCGHAEHVYNRHGDGECIRFH